MDEFRSTILSEQIDVACVSETWFKTNTPEENIQVEGFVLYSRPCPDRLHGGVALHVYVRDLLHPQPMDVNIPDNLEIVWVHIRPNFLPRKISRLYYAANVYVLTTRGSSCRNFD